VLCSTIANADAGGETVIAGCNGGGSCNAGYHSNNGNLITKDNHNGFVCTANLCLCSGGTGVTTLRTTANPSLVICEATSVDHDCSACDAGKYLTNDGNTATEACSACADCGVTFESTACTMDANRACTACQDVVNKADTATVSCTECAVCSRVGETDCADGFYRVAGTTCADAASCADSSYADTCAQKQCTCTDGTGTTGAACPTHNTASCVKCTAGTHYKTAETAETPAACAECATCAAGTYESVACNPDPDNSPTQNRICPNCNPVSFAADDATLTCNGATDSRISSCKTGYTKVDGVDGVNGADNTADTCVESACAAGMLPTRQPL
jgi:hypothetical protein